MLIEFRFCECPGIQIYMKTTYMDDERRTSFLFSERISAVRKTRRIHARHRNCWRIETVEVEVPWIRFRDRWSKLWWKIQYFKFFWKSWFHFAVFKYVGTFFPRCFVFEYSSNLTRVLLILGTPFTCPRLMLNDEETCVYLLRSELPVCVYSPGITECTTSWRFWAEETRFR